MRFRLSQLQVSTHIDLDMFRFIQLRQTGLDSSNADRLAMCLFRLFGRLMDPG
jgi:hypothetical protein